MSGVMGRIEVCPSEPTCQPVSNLWVNKRTSQLLDALFPGSCLLCGLRCNSRIPLCVHCREDLQPNDDGCGRCARPLAAGTVCGGCLQHPPGFSRALVPWRYDPLMSTLIRRWKDH